MKIVESQRSADETYTGPRFEQWMTAKPQRALHLRVGDRVLWGAGQGQRGQIGRPVREIAKIEPVQDSYGKSQCVLVFSDDSRSGGVYGNQAIMLVTP